MSQPRPPPCLAPAVGGPDASVSIWAGRHVSRGAHCIVGEGKGREHRTEGERERREEEAAAVAAFAGLPRGRNSQAAPLTTKRESSPHGVKLSFQTGRPPKQENPPPPLRRARSSYSCRSGATASISPLCARVSAALSSAQSLISCRSSFAFVATSSHTESAEENRQYNKSWIQCLICFFSLWKRKAPLSTLVLETCSQETSGVHFP